MIGIFLSLIIPLINGECTHFPNDTLYIVATLRETIEINAYGIFDVVLNQNSEYRCYPQSDYVIFDSHNPLELISESEYPLSLDKEIISQKPYKSKDHIDFINYWSILSRKENKYFLEYNSKLQGTTPQIDSSQQLNLKVDSTCYDVVQLLNVYIIECNNAEGDYFAILEEGTVTTLQIQNATINQQRKIDQLDDILIRTLKNQLEVYQLQQDKQLLLKGILTTEILKVLTSDDTFNLEIVDFKIHTNTYITILNQQGQFLILGYNLQSNTWILNKYLITQIDQPYGYDFVFYSQNNNSYQLSILSEGKLYYSFVTSAGNIDRTMNIPTIGINSKVYMSYTNYILLQNQQSLSFYASSMNTPFWSINVPSLTFVHQYPHFSSFLLFAQPYFYAFNFFTSSLRLKIHSNHLIQEYEKFTIELTNSYKQMCKATIYVKIVEIASNDIFQIFLNPKITCNRDQQDLNNYCDYIQQYSGKQIQLEFDHNDALDLNYNLTIPFDVYNMEDSKQIIYRKFLTYQKEFFVIIEQIQNMQVKGYSCFEDQKQSLLCQTIFYIDNFVQVIDTPLQSWYSYGYSGLTIFALANGNLVEIYYTPENRDFQQVITFQVSSTIKKIYVLPDIVWLLQEKEVQVYSFNFFEYEATLLFTRSADNIFMGYWASVGNVLFNFMSDQTIDLDNDSNVIDLVSDDKLLFILVKKKDQYFGYFYETQDYWNTKQKYFQQKRQIDLSQYKDITIVNIESCDISSTTYYIYLNALRGETRVLLCYRPKQNSIDSLYFELQISETTQISSCDQRLLLTDKQNQIFQQYLILDHFTEAIHGKANEEKKQIQFSQALQIPGRIFNQFNSYKKEIPVNLLNRGIELFAVVSQLNFTYKKDELDSHCFDLGQSWYSGQAFEIDLKEPVEDLQYLKTLIKQIDTIEFSSSIMEYDSNTLVQLMKNKIVLVSKADFKSTEFPLDNKYTFINILYIFEDLIYVKAQENQYHPNIFCVIKCKDYNCQLQDGCNQFNYKGKILFINKLHFFMEDTNADMILIYDTNGDPSNLLGFQYINLFDLKQWSSSINVSYLFENIYLILSINQECQLNVYNLNVANELTIKKFQYFKIKEAEPVLNSLRSKCNNILTKNDEIIVSGKGQPTVIFQLVKQCNQNYCEISLKSKSLLQMYAMHEPLRISFNENIYSMYYYGEVKKEYGLLFYDTTNDFTNLQPNLAIAYQPIESENQTSIVYNHDGQLHLLIAQGVNKQLQHYTLKRSPEICSTKSINKDVQFILKNSYNTVTVQIKLNITQIVPPGPDPPGPDPPGPNPPGPNPPDPDPTPDDKNGIVGLLLWCVGGAVALGVGVGITIWCCKKKKVGDFYEL